MNRTTTSRIVILGCACAISFIANHPATAQLGGGRGDGDLVAENPPSDENKAMITLSIWILKLSESHEDADAELTARIASQAASLSPMVGSVSEVRELVGKMRAAGLLRSERELRMVTLDGQPVTTHAGRNRPRIVATSSDPRRGRTSSIAYEPTGTKIEARPQLTLNEFIQVNVNIEESKLEKSTDVTIEAPAEGGPVFADVVTTQQFSTTARTKNGSAVLLQRDAALDSDDPSRDATELIILGAAVVKEPD
jgi:hypothetical protein